MRHVTPFERECHNPDLGYGAYGPDTYRYCNTCTATVDTLSGETVVTVEPLDANHIRSLRVTLRSLVQNDFHPSGSSNVGTWIVGADHGKAIVGNAILGAMDDTGLDRLFEMELALFDVDLTSEFTDNPDNLERTRKSVNGVRYETR